MKKFFEFYHELEKRKKFLAEISANWKWGERWKRGGIKVRGGVNVSDLSDRLNDLDYDNPIYDSLKLAQMISGENPSLKPSMIPLIRQFFQITGNLTPSFINLIKKGAENTENLDLAIEFLELLEHMYGRISRQAKDVLRSVEQKLRSTESGEISDQTEKEIQSLNMKVAEAIQVLKEKAVDFRSKVNLKNWRN